jgi:hypothetical protein
MGPSRPKEWSMIRKGPSPLTMRRKPGAAKEYTGPGRYADMNIFGKR